MKEEKQLSSDSAISFSHNSKEGKINISLQQDITKDIIKAYSDSRHKKDDRKDNFSKAHPCMYMVMDVFKLGCGTYILCKGLDEAGKCIRSYYASKKNDNISYKK